MRVQQWNNRQQSGQSRTQLYSHCRRTQTCSVDFALVADAFVSPVVLASHTLVSGQSCPKLNSHFSAAACGLFHACVGSDVEELWTRPARPTPTS